MAGIAVAHISFIINSNMEESKHKNINNDELNLLLSDIDAHLSRNKNISKNCSEINNFFLETPDFSSLQKQLISLK